MKTVKLLLMLALAIPAVAMDLDYCNPAIREAAVDLFEAVENCDRNDGQHEARMNAFRDSSYNLSAIDCKRILESRVESAKRKSQRFQCNECRDVERFIVGGIQELSKAIVAGKGDMLAVNVAVEGKKRNEQ